MRHAIIDGETMQVVNLIIWDGAEFLPPRGHLVVRSDEALLGDTYDASTNKFTSQETD